MSYCAQADIQEQLPEADLIMLTDDADAGVVDTSVVTRAIADADAKIDAYCQGRYTVPLSPVPDMIRRVSVDLAIYNLYSRRDSFGMPEIRSERKKDAVSYLKDVAAGKVTLGSATPAAQNSADSVQVSSSDRVFSRDTLSGF